MESVRQVIERAYEFLGVELACPMPEDLAAALAVVNVLLMSRGNVSETRVRLEGGCYRYWLDQWGLKAWQVQAARCVLPPIPSNSICLYDRILDRITVEHYVAASSLPGTPGPGFPESWCLDAELLCVWPSPVWGMLLVLTVSDEYPLELDDILEGPTKTLSWVLASQLIPIYGLGDDEGLRALAGPALSQLSRISVVRSPAREELQELLAERQRLQQSLDRLRAA